MIITFLKNGVTITMESQQQLNIIPIKFCLVSEKLLSISNRFFDEVVQEQYQFHQIIPLNWKCNKNYFDML